MKKNILLIAVGVVLGVTGYLFAYPKIAFYIETVKDKNAIKRGETVE
jgi:hypothetical protein